ncbi:MAG TPA: transcription antitermination factor NusB [Patescibacteria group bacterium]|jgi:N utilization substance protein B|nr:transcription antitermination factor NusB [Patescibacteria group bacterium]
MASNRHLGRIVALQTLYEFDFRRASGDSSVDIDEVLDRNILQYGDAVEDKGFIHGLVQGVIDNKAELDSKLQPLAPDWALDQIAKVDYVILCAALYELLYSSEHVPPKVAINEAVELAKAFGGDNSSKFVNGVLGTAYRTLVEPNESKTDDPSTKI